MRKHPQGCRSGWNAAQRQLNSKLENGALAQKGLLDRFDEKLGERAARNKNDIGARFDRAIANLGR